MILIIKLNMFCNDKINGNFNCDRNTDLAIIMQRA